MAQQDRRLELDALLRSALGSGNVYFQPTGSVQMKYPAIVYSRSRIDNTSADNIIYKQDNLYTITAIYSDPDCDLVDRLSKIPRIKFDRPYVASNLYHMVFTLFWY